MIINTFIGTELYCEYTSPDGSDFNESGKRLASPFICHVLRLRLPT